MSPTPKRNEDVTWRVVAGGMSTVVIILAGWVFMASKDDYKSIKDKVGSHDVSIGEIQTNITHIREQLDGQGKKLESQTEQIQRAVTILEEFRSEHRPFD